MNHTCQWATEKCIYVGSSLLKKQSFLAPSGLLRLSAEDILVYSYMARQLCFTKCYQLHFSAITSSAYVDAGWSIHELSSPSKRNFIQFKLYENDLTQKFLS